MRLNFFLYVHRPFYFSDLPVCLVLIFCFFYYHCARAMCIFVYEESPPFNSFGLLDPTTPQFLYDFILWFVLL